MACMLALIVWKREKVATNAVGFGALGVFTLFFVLGGLDPNFRLIITKPDNVPIVGLIFLLVFFVWYSMKQAVLNDRRITGSRKSWMTKRRTEGGWRLFSSSSPDC